jgi:hypothetical protein
VAERRGTSLQSWSRGFESRHRFHRTDPEEGVMTEVKPGPGADIRTYSDDQLAEQRERTAERGDNTDQLDREMAARWRRARS